MILRAQVTCHGASPAELAEALREAAQQVENGVASTEDYNYILTVEEDRLEGFAGLADRLECGLSALEADDESIANGVRRVIAFLREESDESRPMVRGTALGAMLLTSPATGDLHQALKVVCKVLHRQGDLL